MGYPELIRAVVLRAAQEAIGKRTTPAVRIDALDWLQSDDCAWYCDAVGLPGEDVRKWAQRKKHELIYPDKGNFQTVTGDQIMDAVTEQNLIEIVKAAMTSVMAQKEKEAQPAPDDYFALQDLIRQQVREAAGIKMPARKRAVDLDSGILPADISSADLAELIQAQVLETINGGK